jgi:FixJ family two-component response regulator
MLMPGMSGEEVFSVLHQIDPAVRVLLVSGFTSEQALDSVLQRGGRDFIQKPFTVESLARKVRRCVDEQ